MCDVNSSMSDKEEKKESGNEDKDQGKIEYKVDDDSYYTNEKEMTPRDILHKAHFDPKQVYLIQITDAGETSYKDNVDEKILMYSNMVFITARLGPTPVSKQMPRMTPFETFVDELKKLNFDVTVHDGNKVSFPYVIPVGKFRGTEITLGFVVPSDFPNTPPGGPHIKPQILPINPRIPEHPGRVHPSSEFGQSWEYWSRPLKEMWAESDHSVKFYMSHIRQLFETQ